MKIRVVRLVNFRNFEDRTFQLADRTFLAGLNGAGKSTVIDAISWALRGVCRGTDAGGRGAKDLIRIGADQASVTLSGDMGTITRSVGRNGSSSCSVKPEAILAKLDATDAAVESVLYGRAFFGLHHKDAKDLLLKVLDVRIPQDRLPGVELTEPADLGTLDMLYRAAFEARAAAKKALAGVILPDLPKVVTIERDPDLLAAQAKDARAKERDASGTVARLTSELHAAVMALQKLTPVNVDELTGKKSVHSTMLATERQKATDLAATLESLRSQEGLSAGELTAKIADRSNLITKIQGHNPGRGCVLSPDIPCLTDAKAFLSQVKEIQGQVKALKGELKEIEARTRDMAQTSQAKADADRAVIYHQSQIGQIDAALASADQVIKAIETHTADRARLESELNQARIVQAEAIQASEILAGKVREATEYQTAVRNRQTAEGRRTELQAELDRLNAQVDLLGPNGVRVKALGDAVADFEAAINAALDGFGFRIAFNVEPWRVEILRDGMDGWLPFDLLSDGEKLWTGACFQQALAMVTGLDFVAVDAAETVVGEDRALLTGLIMMSPIGQIIVAMAKGETDPLPNIDGLTVIAV